AERAPRFGEYSALGVESAELALLETRVQRDLVDRRHDAGGVDDPLQVLDLEVRDADRPDATLFAQRAQRLPRFQVQPAARDRPKDQLQVYLVATQSPD